MKKIKQITKAYIGKTRWFPIIKKVYRSICPVSLPLIQYIIKKFAKTKKNVFFIQIGSNDGISGDPLFPFVEKYQWNGILVEPVPYLFQKLKTNYKNNGRLIFENVAISSEIGIKKFFRLKHSISPDLPFWYDQIGSFKKQVVLKHKTSIPNFDALLIEENVTTITFEKLVEKHNILKVDLLHIDTEGYDYEIIKLIDFNKISPELLIFENKHLAPSDYTACKDLLVRFNYKIYEIEDDSICIYYKSKGLLEMMEKVFKTEK